jgi:hypothetical protein
VALLGGTRPADLPFEEPSHYKLVINLKTAKATGIELPVNFVALADEVIEYRCFAAAHLVAFWHKADMSMASVMSAFGGKADIRKRGRNVSF